jgi:hypothetical protein
MPENCPVCGKDNEASTPEIAPFCSEKCQRTGEEQAKKDYDEKCAYELERAKRLKEFGY